MAEVAFGKLVGDEFLGALRHDLARKLAQVSKSLLAANVAGFEDGGQDGVVGFGEADALVDAACGMADFLPRVPQGIENEFDDVLRPPVCLAGSTNRRSMSEPAPACRGHNHPRPRRRCALLLLGGGNAAAREIEQSRE